MLRKDATPMFFVNAFFYKTEEAAVRPIPWFFHQPMLDRIIMDVINMAIKVVLIPDQMFPKPPLPQTLFFFLLHGVRRSERFAKMY